MANSQDPLEPVAWLFENERSGDPGEQKYGVIADDALPDIRELVAAFPVYAAPQLAQPENHDSVRIPIGEDEAAMMVMLGTNWLKAHAPGRLAQSRGETEPPIRTGGLLNIPDVMRRSALAAIMRRSALAAIKVNEGDAT